MSFMQSETRCAGLAAVSPPPTRERHRSTTRTKLNQRRRRRRRQRRCGERAHAHRQRVSKCAPAVTRLCTRFGEGPRTPTHEQDGPSKSSLYFAAAGGSGGTLPRHLVADPLPAGGSAEGGGGWIWRRPSRTS